jgi:hypothetical protein
MPTRSTSWYHYVPPPVNVESTEGFYKTLCECLTSPPTTLPRESRVITIRGFRTGSSQQDAPWIRSRPLTLIRVAGVCIGGPGRSLVFSVKSLSGSIKCWKILEQLSDWRFLKYDSPPRSFFSKGGMRLSALGTPATVCLLYHSRKIDDECAAVGGMRIGRGNHKC